MHPTSSERLEKVLVIALLACFATPLVLAGVLLLPGMDVPVTDWLRNRTLVGQGTQSEAVTLSASALQSARYQAACATNYNLHFPGRELMVRLINEFYLRVFHVTSVGVLVGPRNSLIYEVYAREYCLERPSRDKLVPLVEDIRRMQDFCGARGIAFALVVTPSKAAIYPESLPTRWLHRYRPAPRGFDRFLSLLQEKGIRYVDGHRITAELKGTAAAPLFPLGGVHWGKEAVIATANGLLELLIKEGLPVQPIRGTTTRISFQPVGRDADMISLVNGLFPMRYPIAIVTVPPVPTREGYRPNMVVISGSFMFSMLEALDDSQQFSELDYYFYYKRFKGTMHNGFRHDVATPTPPLNFETDVFSADALVLEANEQTLPDAVPHLTAFLHDALLVLPNPHAAKAPFHYETRTHYRWGDTLSLSANTGTINFLSTSGFTGFSTTGAWTVGPVATIRLDAPAATEDKVLEVEASALLVDTRVPQQRVSVYVNGHAVGDWLWQAGTPSRHELLVPKDLLAADSIRLEFHIARPVTLAEFGLSRDSNPYGIYVSSIRLRGVGK